MKKKERIQAINKVLKEFFADSSNPRIVQAKEFMNLFISNGIFNQNDQDGLPIRKLLRELNQENKISAIPYALGKKKEKNINWFFIDSHTDIGADTHPFSIPETTKRPKSTITRKSNGGRINSDEYYVIGLCNKVLGLNASQQHYFDFLVGDSGRKLPVDAYYEDLNLVVEYCESQHTSSTPFFDKKKTVSGVSRGEQRRLYDERRRIELPRHGIKLISIHYYDFGTTKRLKRNHELDIEIVREKLCDYVKSKKV